MSFFTSVSCRANLLCVFELAVLVFCCGYCNLLWILQLAVDTATCCGYCNLLWILQLAVDTATCCGYCNLLWILQLAVDTATCCGYCNLLWILQPGLVGDPLYLDRYDEIAAYHSAAIASSAHGGPAFLPWHRVYLLILENALRRIDPSVTIPYWNSNLDANMMPEIDARHSIIWTPRFVGRGTDIVNNWAVRILEYKT
ncbi:hypothetical protein FSP39_016368 [Pinctada imbricata]|uniref:Tyrosinase copper-binding domain-containing protein n=1 Tax=Pinctada imbricata TaxID=66713 RepID=A0AA88XDH6_PINIB|nr:hypothetical protein FSP39_016368 [Pinctada imbricata]